MVYNSKFVFILVLVFSFVFPTALFAASPAIVNLGTAGNFVILSKTLITTTGATAITGDIGVSPAAATFIQGFSLSADPSNVFSTSTYVTGKVYAADYAVPTPSYMSTAITDMETAYNDAAGRTPLTEPIDTRTATLPLGTTFTTGIYKWSTAVNITGDITISGNASDIFIFQIAGNLDIAANKKVLLTGGALASNIFWAVAGTTTLEAGSIFEGNILGGPGVSTIAMQSFAQLDGRALGQKDVSLIANTISTLAPTTHLTVTKVVNNTHGGTKVVADFPLFIDGVSVTSGVVNTVSAGPHTISETSSVGYTSVISGNCASDGTITLTSGDSKSCTITNSDIAPAPATINVVKVVVNTHGRTKVVANFPLFVNGTPVTSGVTNTFAPGAYTITETIDPNYTQVFSIDCDSSGHLSIIAGDSKTCTITNSDTPIAVQGSGGLATPVPPLIDVVKVPTPLSLPNGPGPVTYTYTLYNIGTVPVTNITLIGDTCSPIKLISGDKNNDAKLDVNEVWIYNCFTTLLQTHTNTVTATGWANGISAVDIASATVVVGLPVVPPLIHVTKIPNPLLLSVAGGLVTYNETITNPGTTPLSNVHLTDDKCSPVTYISGDTNTNSLLEVNETWRYTCESRLLMTTTNTATAEGVANGITVKDFAIATVVVASPSFPKTGFAPETNYEFIKNIFKELSRYY